MKIQIPSCGECDGCQERGPDILASDVMARNEIVLEHVRVRTSRGHRCEEDQAGLPEDVSKRLELVHLTKELPSRARRFRRGKMEVAGRERWR